MLRVTTFGKSIRMSSGRDSRGGPYLWGSMAGTRHGLFFVFLRDTNCNLGYIAIDPRTQPGSRIPIDFDIRLSALVRRLSQCPTRTIQNNETTILSTRCMANFGCYYSLSYLQLTYFLGLHTSHCLR